MPEIGVLGSGRDDEIVVRNASSVCDNLVPRSIDARDLRQDDLRVFLPTEYAANRRGDIRGRQAGGRNLIEQRLEQMIIVAVDDGDVERRLRQSLGGRKATEARADDDHTRASGPSVAGGHAEFTS